MTVLSVLVLVLSTPAVAQGTEPGGDNVVSNQVFLGTQEGENTVVTNGPGILNGPIDSDEADALLDDFVEMGGELLGPAPSIDNVDQSILNAANLLLSRGTNLASATQVMQGSQTARNLIDEQGAGVVGTSTQTGENIANVIIATRVDEIRQSFGPDAMQEVFNTLRADSQSGGTITQIGRNTANIVMAEISIGSGEQLFPEGTVQRVENLVDFVQVGSNGGHIDQRGTNIGNVLMADEVHNVHRVFDGEQIVNNVVSSADGQTPGSVNQEGLNIANFVSARVVSGLTQTSNGTQTVTNSLEGATLADYEAGLVPGWTQSTTNIVNLLDIRGGGSPMPATSTGPSGETVTNGNPNANMPVSATQNANQQQNFSGGNGNHMQIGNAASVRY
ncbi:hypothetical protein [Jannaschia ovalis]|uniref:Curlin associated repeat-containing protein n=1 Tax=Jannaschia ovalis TaxID=3038773 RepID=A0ABY8LAI1_9RHOB|nr:hypothetical protein [Jannaschia sp. GRR-S6-38]WGH78136.1 hypothetical protein P8627_14030 [Jannaschia sp. GRR-S6-38]